MYDILASIYMLMGDPVFRVCPDSRIRAPPSETRDIQVIPYHYRAPPLHSRCLKDSLLNISSCGGRELWLDRGDWDAPAVRACCPVHAGRGRSMMYLESLVSY